MSHFSTKRVIGSLMALFAVVSTLFLYQNCSGGFSVTEPNAFSDLASTLETNILPSRSILSAANPMVESSSSPVASEPTLVFVLAGQSNMEGYAVASQIRDDEKLIPGNVSYYIESQKQNVFGANGKFGPEIGIAYVLSSTFPNQKIVLIKSALGGTSQRRWALGAQDNNGALITGSGDLFIKMKNSVNEVLNRDFGGQSLKLNGFFWMQGESDADEFTLLGQKYAFNMQKFLDQVNSEFQKSPDFRFVMGRIYQYGTSSMIERGVSYEYLRWPEYFQKIRESQSNLQLPFNSRIVSTDELSMQDFWHFDAWSVLSLGKCFAQGYLVTQKFLGCTKTTGINPTYPSDQIQLAGDDRIRSIRADVTQLYRQILNKEPDDEGLRYWVAEVYKGKPYSEVEAAMTNVLPACSAQNLASAIDGKCHFGFSCQTQATAAAEISKNVASYGSCKSAQAITHPDCVATFGAARGYIAACPLMRANETLKTDGSTLTGRVADHFKTIRKRMPDQEGLNYWVGQIQSGASTEQALVNALQGNPTPPPPAANPLCSSQPLASAINGKCHFNFSCTSQSAAAAEIAKNAANYSSCSTAQPVSHPDCVNSFGTARGYIAVCPLMNTTETLKLDGSTLTGRVADLFKIHRKRNPDSEGLTYWVTRIQSGAATEQNLSDSLQGISTPAPATPACSAQPLASAINGKCHFNFSCTSQSAAAAEIAKHKTNYSSCANVQPVTHADCMNAYGAARGYIAACPLMNASETLKTDSSTLTGRVADQFKIHRKRMPDQEGLNYWVQQIQSGASTEAALSNALQK